MAAKLKIEKWGEETLIVQEMLTDGRQMTNEKL
jgi:hypothetical protein